ncbi:MAG: 50S ribosomal protein L17 [Bdellovibrionaceae bacterium]|nr:50S ribosomal protein L17 [Pseudobdellovibrionaceae bacterium]MBX3032405.1 50S ribosomal protein L17 [Pseudobdellovibrionaceae bacterium]
MSSHRRRTSYFSRATKPRLALIRGLMVSLVEHGRIKTTVHRAKEVRRHIEKAITLGKKGDLASTRLLLSRLPNKDAVQSIVKDISVRFKSRPGGYTRVVKIGRRPGDTAEMAFLEFVDYDWKDKGEKADGKGADKEKSAKKTARGVKKAAASVVAAKKKSAKKIQKRSRAASRA